MPIGYQIKDAIDAPANWRTKIRKPLDTTVRRTYGTPQQHDKLMGNTTRYGCNQKKGIAALGAGERKLRGFVRRHDFQCPELNVCSK